MISDIAVKNIDLVKAIEDTSITDIIKPFVTEIHLFDTKTTGADHKTCSLLLFDWFFED